MPPRGAPTAAGGVRGSEKGEPLRQEANASQVTTRPNQGLKMNEITGLLHHGEGRLTVTGYHYVETLLLLLNDGWLYDNLHCAPADLDVAASKRLEPGHWHRWKRNGSEILVQRSDRNGQPEGNWTAQPGVLVTPADLRSRVAGRFGAANAIRLGSAASTSRDVYTFDGTGHYRYSRSSLMTGGYSLPDNGTGVSGAVISGGATSTFSPTGSFTAARGSKSSEGSYLIDGYTLELHPVDGPELRQVFYVDKDGRSILIGGRTYSTESK